MHSTVPTWGGAFVSTGGSPAGGTGGAASGGSANGNPSGGSTGAHPLTTLTWLLASTPARWKGGRNFDALRPHWAREGAGWRLTDLAHADVHSGLGAVSMTSHVDETISVIIAALRTELAVAIFIAGNLLTSILVRPRVRHSAIRSRCLAGIRVRIEECAAELGVEITALGSTLNLSHDALAIAVAG